MNFKTSQKAPQKAQPQALAARAKTSKFIKVKWLIFFLILALIVGTARAQDPKTIPEFSLPDFNGKTFTQNDFKGKVVVMDFWATWCVTCREAYPILNKMHNELKNIAVIGISIDQGSAKKIRRFLKKFDLQYQLLWDKDHTLKEPLSLEAIPTVMVFDKNGKTALVLRDYGPEQEKQLQDLVKKLALNNYSANPASIEPTR